MAAALLMALTLAACGRHEATSSPAAPLPSYAALDTGASSSPDSGASDSPNSSSSAGSPTDPPGPTAPDPAASELDQINQLINDINNSIQDSSNQGGE